mmetsp:Transcript_31391/g.42447  ORF Transcript_31391/g.42447 Transcript_31391/m.42447 type:complete len:95 (-) Transcript_31391:154-438(-)
MLLLMSMKLKMMADIPFRLATLSAAKPWTKQCLESLKSNAKEGPVVPTHKWPILARSAASHKRTCNRASVQHARAHAMHRKGQGRIKAHIWMRL